MFLVALIPSGEDSSKQAVETGRVPATAGLLALIPAEHISRVTVDHLKLDKKERELLKLVASLIEKALAADGSARKGDGRRRRRSRADIPKLRKQVLAARQGKMSVREIADELEVTPAYVYRLLR